MPMIDVYAASALFSKDSRKALGTELTNAVLRAEGVAQPGMFHLKNTCAFLHLMDEGTITTAAGDIDVNVRVQIITPPNALNRSGQIRLVREITDIIAKHVGDPMLAERTWVLLTEAAEGGWGIAGTAYGKNEFLALASKAATASGLETNVQTLRVPVQRWTIVSHKPFEVVVAAVEAALGKPNMTEFASMMAAATTYEQMRTVVQNSVSEIGLMEFMRLDHGAVLTKAGVEGGSKSVRLIMGNPLIMQSMARLVPDAGSYAPVTVLINQQAAGVHLSYDEMTSFLAPYGNAEALQIAHDLDAKVKSLLESAA